MRRYCFPTYMGFAWRRQTWLALPTQNMYCDCKVGCWDMTWAFKWLYYWNYLLGDFWPVLQLWADFLNNLAEIAGGWEEGEIRKGSTLPHSFGKLCLNTKNWQDGMEWARSLQPGRGGQVDWWKRVVWFSPVFWPSFLQSSTASQILAQLILTS